MYIIQSKNGIVINVGVSVKNEMIEVLAKMIICETVVNRIFSCKIDKYFKHQKLFMQKTSNCKISFRI